MSWKSQRNRIWPWELDDVSKGFATMRGWDVRYMETLPQNLRFVLHQLFLNGIFEWAFLMDFLNGLNKKLSGQACSILSFKGAGFFFFKVHKWV